MADDVTPALLQPWPRVDSETESITTRLARINYERGHFRHLTTESLETELAVNGANQTFDTAAQNNHHDQAAGRVVGDETQTDEATPTDTLQLARMELQAHVASAQNEALMALDFVSLLLSKDMPRQAELTMSPFLKNQLKPGTLGIDMWQNMPPDKTRDETDPQIARGWRMHMLQQSADSLLQAAARLETSVRKETQYWIHVLGVSDSGWPVCRMPRERHTLGVCFGFPEAAGEYKSRGMAALRSTDDGDVWLDRGQDARPPQTIRVRMMQNNTDVVSHSRLNPYLVADRVDVHDQPLQAKIRQARDSIFEEELFHEMMHETRLLKSHGVEMSGTAVVIPTRPPNYERSTAEHISIDLVAVNEATDLQDDKPDSERNAEAIALVSRLLLSHAHRIRLQMRSEVPAPLTIHKRDRPSVWILRPIMALARHQTALRDLSDRTIALSRLFANAQLDFEVSRPAAMASDALTEADTVQKLMTAIVDEPIRSEIHLRVPNCEGITAEIRISVATGLQAPLHGTIFTAVSDRHPLDFEVSDIDALTVHVDYIISGMLTRCAAARLDGWTPNEYDATVEKNTLPNARRQPRRSIRIVLKHQMDGRGGGDGEMVCILAVKDGQQVRTWSSQERTEESFTAALSDMAVTDSNQ